MTRSRGRAARVIAKPLKVLGISLLGLCGLVVAALLCANLPPVRAFVAARANDALRDALTGQVTIERIGSLGLRGVTGVSATVRDGAGRRVADLRGASVSLNWPRLVWDLLVAKPDPLVVRFDSIAIDHVEARLIDDGAGRPTLAAALTPRSKTPPTRRTVVELDRIELGHAWVHGRLGTAPAIDVEAGKLVMRLRTAPDGTEIDVKELDFVARGLPRAVDPRGRLSGQARLTPSPEERRVALRFEGRVAAFDTRLEGRLAGERVDAELHATGSADAVARQLPALEPRGPSALDLKASGTLDRVVFELELATPGGRLRGSGELRGRATAEVRLEARAVDLAGFSPDLAPSRLDLDATARFEQRGSITRGSYNVTLLPSRFGALALPRVEASGTFAQTAGGQRLAGVLQAFEPGANTRITYTLARQGRAWLELEGETELDDPARLAALVPGFSAAGRVTAQARIELDQRWVDGRVGFELSLAHPSFSAGSLRGSAELAGPLPGPDFTVDLGARDVRAARQELTMLDVEATGSPRAAEVRARAALKDRRTAALSTRVELEPTPSLHDSELALGHAQDELTLRAALIELDGGLRVNDLTLEGVGTARASLRYGRELEHLALESQELELARLARLLGAHPPFTSARATLRARYDGAGGAPSAALEGCVTELDFGRVRGGVLNALVLLEGHELRGAVEADLARGAEARFELAGVAVPEGPWNRDTLRTLTGRAALRGRFDLSYLASELGFEEASGVVELAVRAERSTESSALPDLQASVETRGLSFVSKRQDVADESPDAARAVKPFSLEGIDFDGELAFDSQSREARLTLRTFDEKSDLARLRAMITVPSKLDVSASALREIPVTAHLEVPERRLSTLPPLFALTGSEGRGSLDVKLEGTANDPRARVALRIDGLRPEGTDVPPLDFFLSGSLDRAGGTLRLRAKERTRRVAVLLADWEGNLAALASGVPGGRWRGSGVLELDRLPLATIPGSEEYNLAGQVSGRLEVRDLGDRARLTARLDTQRLRLGDAQVDRGTFELSTRARELSARVVLERERGRLQASLKSAMLWRDRLTPRLSAPLDLDVDAREFQLAGLSVFTGGALSELEGRLNARLSGRFGPESAALEGRATLHDGAAQPRSLGQRFHDIGAEVNLEPGLVRLTRLSARGASGRLDATGSAQLDGLSLRQAEAELRVRKGQKIPVTFEGVALGDAWGKVSARYRAGAPGHPPEIRVLVPELHLVQPESTTLGVQPLADAPFVQIGVQRSDGEFVRVPLQPLDLGEPEPEPSEPLIITIELGDDVSIARGTQLYAKLRGNIRATVAQETALEGQIRVSEGTLDVQGKRFRIERGIVTFTGQDYDNPTVVANARWESPSDYRVMAEYTGTAQEGTLTLTSEPSLTQQEILSLLLFGSPEGTQEGSSGTAAAAFSLAGGTATRGLNRALSKFTELDIDARVDTSAGTSRPELAVQISPRLAARVTHTLGEPPPGQPPDRTFATLDLRITGRWSIAAMVGDRGASALDLLWRWRY